MALQKQALQLAFQKGLDNSDDPKLVISSRFTRMENLEWRGKNTIRQRPGFTAASLTPQTNTPAPSNIRRLMALGAEVLLESDTGLCAFIEDHVVTRDECGGGFIGSRIKTFERAAVSFDDVAASQRDQFDFDCAADAASGLECWAWVELTAASGFTKRAVFYKVVDSATRATVQEGTVFFDNALSNEGWHPRVLKRVNGGATRFYIYYARSTVGPLYEIDVSYVQIAAGAKVPGALSAGVQVPLSGMNSDGDFDAVWDLNGGTDRIAIAFCDNFNTPSMITVDGADGITLKSGGSAITGAHTGALHMAIVVVGDNTNTLKYAVMTYQIGTSVIYSSSMKLDGTSHVDATLATPSIPARVTSIVNPYANGQAMVFYEFNPYTAPTNAFSCDIGYVVMTYQGAAVGGTESTFARGLTLAAKPIAYTSGLVTDICVPAALLSDLQPTVFALKFGGAGVVAGFGSVNSYTSPRVLARILPSECGSYKKHWASFPRIASCLALSGIRLPIAKAGKPQFEAGLSVAASRLALASLDVTPALSSVEAQRALFIAGACPMSYDGDIAHEAGFNHYPEGVTGTASTAGGALTSSVTYGGIFVYEWEDAKGVLWRSETSVPVSVVMGVGNNTITWKFPYLRLTDKQGVDDGAAEQRNNVKISLYRTVGNGTIYYRETAPVTGQGERNRLSLNACGSWVSVQSDASLISNELLYTTGGGLDNEAWPSSGVAAQHQNRVFFVTPEEQDWVQYTDEIDERFIAPGTNQVYRLRVPPEAGKVVGLASMDDKLILIGEHRIYYVYGQGPNRLGTDNSYSEPQICSALIGGLAGCQESLALTPDGLWFMSAQRGLRLLTRSLEIAMMPGAGDDNTAYLGAEVDDLFAGAFATVRAHAIDGRSQVRFLLSGSGATSAVVWDYQQRQWSKFTNHDSTGGSTVARAVYWHSNGTGLYSSKTGNAGSDNGTYTAQVLESAWIALSDHQGYQRIYQLMILAQALDACSLQVEIGYDYADAYVSSVIRESNAIIPLQGIDYTGAGGAAIVPSVLFDLTVDPTHGVVGTVLFDAAGNQPGSSTTNTGSLVFSTNGGLLGVGDTVTGSGGFSATITAVYALADTSALSVAVGDTLTDTGWSSVASVLVTILGRVFALLSDIGAGNYALFNVSTSASVSRPFKYSVAGAQNPLQVTHPMSAQKCEAFRFRLTITPTSEVEAIRLTSFAVQVGLLPGLNRLPTVQRF